jgi:hypothetical protein
MINTVQGRRQIGTPQAREFPTLYQICAMEWGQSPAEHYTFIPRVVILMLLTITKDITIDRSIKISVQKRHKIHQVLAITPSHACRASKSGVAGWAIGHLAQAEGAIAE